MGRRCSGVLSPHQAQQAGFFTTGSLPVRRGHLVKTTLNDKGMVTRRKIAGRANSFIPVIQSPAGFIGGEEFRHWAGPNALEIGAIRNPSGGKFELSGLLSARGRYEAFGKVGKGGARSGRGRAVRDAGGVVGEMIGGTLHDGITIDGPHRNGAEVYGYVKAVAHDPGRTHNYAKDQEFGSRHNRAQPFLRPGLRESQSRIVRMIDPTKGRRGPMRGLMQRSLQMGPRSSSGSGVNVPVQLIVKVNFRGLSRQFWSAVGLEAK
jgi:hypothetical protein